jgi:hypothetical protein
MQEKARAIVLRLDTRLAKALEQSVVGIGWAPARGLDKTTDWNTFKAIICDSYKEEYVGKARALGNAAGSAWRFIHSTADDACVVVPTPGGFLAGTLEGPVYYDESGLPDDFAWRRRVNWKTKEPKPREYAENELQRRLKARQTCVGADDLLTQIKAALERTRPISFGDAVMEGAGAAVTKALKSAITDYGLEHLVKSLAEASGAKAVVMAKNNRAAGDVDVVATYDLRVGNLDSPVKVAYQVKQHEGMSDEFGIQQLIDRMDVLPDEYVHGCFVTTAPEISPEAEELATRKDILVLTNQQLVEWILMVGLEKLGLQRSDKTGT